MKAKLNLVILYLFLIAAPLAHAVLPLPPNVVNLTSKDGNEALEENMTRNAMKLLSHFETQNTVTYCGVASLVTVLNSTSLQPPLDTAHSPPPSQFYYFNQNDFFTDDVKKIIDPSVAKEIGITLDQLAEIAKVYKLTVETYHADDFSAKPDQALKKFRKTLKKALSNGQFVIVNFLRDGISPKMGGGHHSPLAAYDEKNDRFLLLDVARYKYPSYWVKTEDLWNAVNTQDRDAGKMRGVLVLSDDQNRGGNPDNN